MDEIRREAMNDYQHGTEEHKQLAWELFKAMDSDGKGSISIPKLEAFLRQNGLYNDNFHQLFTELDKDNDGALDFEELVTFCFMFTNDKETRDEDPSKKSKWKILRARIADIKKMKDESTPNQNTTCKPNMDEIRREAMNDYQQGTAEYKQLAWEFFKALDDDGNGSISIHEFVAFLRQNGLYSDNFYQLFTELDKDTNGTLDFEELITLFYMLTHDKYRDRFAGTTCDANIDKETEDRSIVYQDERAIKALKRLMLLKSTLEVTEFAFDVAGLVGCSIM